MGVYTSKHFELKAMEVQTLVNKFNIEHKDRGDSIAVRTCFYCPKPTNGERSNEYTLNI